MATTADNLRELHALHQRAKVLRERLSSGPKTLAARQAALEKRKTELEAARDALKRSKADIKGKEVQVQSIRAKTDDLRVRLNTVRKQVEYDAVRNEIAHGNNSASRIEDEILELMSQVETREAALKTLESETTRMNGEVSALSADVAEKAVTYEAQLGELDTAIVEAEQIIPDDLRDQYRRVVKGRGADAMAQVEDGACHGCYVSVTSQMVNELINGHNLVFCKTCGRILYLAEQPHNVLKRGAD